MVAALATIASHLATRIFAPVYIPAANGDIRDLLLRYGYVDSEREAVCRALLLSAYTEEEQRQAAEAVAQEVARTVSETLDRLIGPRMLDAFRADLFGLFRDAMTLWRRTQYSKIKFDATLEDSEDSEWGILGDLYGDESAAESQAQLPPPQSFVTLVLFPRILIVRGVVEEDDEEGDDNEVVFGGIAFWNWQAATAAQELREDMEARRLKRGGSRKERKMAINGSGSVPTSPTKSKGRHFLP